jgi:hypothetical protein
MKNIPVLHTCIYTVYYGNGSFPFHTDFFFPLLPIKLSQDLSLRISSKIQELPFYGGVRVAHPGTPVLWWRPCCSFRNSRSMVASVLVIQELPFYGGVRVAHSGTPVLWWRLCCSFFQFSELFICLFVCFLYCFVVVCLSCSLLVMCSTLPMTMSILDGPFGFL